MSADDTTTSPFNVSSSSPSSYAPESIGSHHARYGEQSPTECWKLNIIALYCLILLILSIIFNSMLLWIFYLYKELRSSLNILIIALTAINLGASCVELPLVTVTNYKCRYVFYLFILESYSLILSIIY